MATILQASTQYAPRLELRTTAQLEKIAEWMAMRTGLNKSEVMMVLQEVSEAILNFRADMELKSGINAHNAYGGEVKNKANAGITNERLKELWDAEHPADPLVIP